MEAVCELRFAPERDWDLSYPWIFYEKIKSTYVGKPREQKLISLEPTATGSPTVIEQSKIQFPMEGDAGLLAIGPDVLSAHVKSPYPGWDVFRSRIESAIKEYVAVASPIGLRQIGLRYINQVIIPGDKINVADYFTFPPANILPSECSVDNFICRNEYIYKDEPITRTVWRLKHKNASGGDELAESLEDRARIIDVLQSFEQRDHVKLGVANHRGQVVELRIDAHEFVVCPLRVGAVHSIGVEAELTARRKELPIAATEVEDPHCGVRSAQRAGQQLKP